MSDGLSMVYSFYDPELQDRSLGTFMILDHIRRAKAMGLPYLYLGYWVDGSKKMAYKARFKPQERLLAHGWVRVGVTFTRHPGRSAAKIRDRENQSAPSCPGRARSRVQAQAMTSTAAVRASPPTAITDPARRRSGMTGSTRRDARSPHPNLFDFGKPFGGRRPASARLPIQSRRSSLATVQVRPEVSFQVRPSLSLKTLASETPPSL